MSRRRSEKRDQAYEIWEKSGRKIKLVDISKRLGISASQVRKWKHLDAWDDKPRRKRGGQPGNKNAAGNSGGGAPPGNKNAWKHGEYESLWMSVIEADHKIKLMQTETDPRERLLNEIRLLEYREYMMMKNMKDIDEGKDRYSVARRYEVFEEEDPDANQEMEIVDGVPKFKPAIKQTKKLVEEKVNEPQKLERILQIHNALTQVQGRKIRCITLLDQFDRNELTTEELKLRIERMQLEVNKLRLEAW